MAEVNFPALEEKILRFWQQNNIFSKTISQRRRATNFVFYEGPPTANGHPGIHHVEARCFKDIICRYKTMRGFRVIRKAGWDTHGLPVELQIEKQLGLNSKKEIEKYGIEKFNRECRKSVWLYKKDWENLTERIGFWIDMKNPYITYEPEYIETVWWLLKKIWEKGLLYKDYKVLPYCPRCGTGLSSHEVAQGYKKVKENSLYLRFNLISSDPQWQNTAILSWTTTPWTLPGNVALAVGPEIEYVKVPDSAKENYWLVIAKPNLNLLFQQGIIKPLSEEELKSYPHFKGSILAGLKYQPLFKVPELETERSYQVYPADFITSEEGTGVVHTAVMYGEEDYQLGKKAGLPTFHTVTEEGRFIEGLEGGLAGLEVKHPETEKIITSLIEERGTLFQEYLYEHDYPFCWRCKTALLYYAKPGWFIAMRQVKKNLLINNQKINWLPAHLKKGRFGEWLNEVKDWALSRERYWGTPLPIWLCQNRQNQISRFANTGTNIKNQKFCNNIKVIGSLKELEKLSGRKVKDPHRPYLDKITIKCDRCGGKMTRVPEVIDCWFDSGAMPFAQQHYPFENKNLIDRRIQFPADYISEAIDQTRGWFYTLLAIATVLGYEAPYKNVISLGLVLDEKGEKMSKSKGNVIDLWLMTAKYGADVIRWYFFTINQPEDPKLFAERDLDRVVKRFFLIFWNSLVFWETYQKNAKRKTSAFAAPSPKLWSVGDKATADKQNLKLKNKSKNILDKWIVSRLNTVIDETTKLLDAYQIVAASRGIEKFIIEDLSQWYIRRSRRRFKPVSEQLLSKESRQDFEAAERTLAWVLLETAKLLAPFIPFLAEEVYQKLKPKKAPFSVHLVDFPWPDKKLINRPLEKEMTLARKIVALTLAKRAEAGIKIRQPLRSLKINQKLRRDYLELIKDEVNVKEVVFGKGLKLDTTLSPALKEEGISREIIRQIQESRKRAKLTPKDIIAVSFFLAEGELEEVIRKWETYLKSETFSASIAFPKEEKELPASVKEFEIEGKKARFAIKAIKKRK